MDMRPDDNLYKIYANKIKRNLLQNRFRHRTCFTYNNGNLNNNNSVDENGCYKSEILSDIIGNIVGKDLIVASECKILYRLHLLSTFLKKRRNITAYTVKR